MTEAFELETIEESKRLVVLFIPEVYMMADIMDKKKVGIPTLAEFVDAQYSVLGCSAVFASVGKLNTRFNVDSDRVFVRVFPLKGASQ